VGKHYETCEAICLRQPAGGASESRRSCPSAATNRCYGPPNAICPTLSAWCCQP